MRLQGLSLVLVLGISSSRCQDSVERLFEDFFNWRMERSPEFSTLIGLKDHNDVLETFTEDRFLNDYYNCNGVYYTLTQIDLKII